MTTKNEPTSYVVVGTRVFMPMSEDAVKRHVPVHEQTAHDEQGRRRFHGAFTGGFSAGFYNTVGSKEGWTPSAFIPKQQRNRVEDYMDEEDMSEAGFAPKLVSTRQAYAPQEKPALPKSKLGWLGDLDDIIKPSNETVGIKHVECRECSLIHYCRLLRLMGWKEGQGVGERLDARKLARMKASARARAVRNNMSRGGEDSSDDEEILQSLQGKTFAPRDVTIAAFEAKDNVHGIGYKPLSAAEFNVGQEVNKRSGGFGVGVLEDDADDDDIYAQDDLRQYDRYLGQSGPVIDRFAIEQPKDKPRLTMNPHEDAVLPGFLKAKAVPTTINQVIPLPELPKDFNPKHIFTTPGPAFTQHKPGTNSRFCHSVLIDLAGGLMPGSAFVCRVGRYGQADVSQNPLSAQQRSAILGEAPPPAVPEPVAEPAPNLFELATKPGVYQPFANDLAKRERYFAYLRGNYEPPEALPEHEREREAVEFQKSATLFRPMAAVMASRFAPSESALPKTDRPLEKPVAPVVEETQKQKAVRMKMFGTLTREAEEWHPHRLLCKRLNIPDPFPKSGLVGVRSGSKGLSKFMSGGVEDASRLSELNRAGVPVANASSAAGTMVPEDDVPRPALDIFKSIFSDSSSSGEDDVPDARLSDDEAALLPSTNQTTAASASATTPAPTPRLPMHAPTSRPEPAVKLELVSPLALDLVAKAQQKTQHTKAQHELHGAWIERTPDTIQANRVSVDAKAHKHKSKKHDSEKHSKKEKKHKEHKKHKKEKDRAKGTAYDGDESSSSEDDKGQTEAALLERLKAAGGARAATAILGSNARHRPTAADFM